MIEVDILCSNIFVKENRIEVDIKNIYLTDR